MNTFLKHEFFLVISFLLAMERHKCHADSNSGMSDTMTKMKAIKDKILNGYDKLIRPTSHDSNTTKVYTTLIPKQIIGVDEETGLFIMDSYFVMTWKDPRLEWDGAAEGYSHWLPMPLNDLWLPKIYVRNSHSVSVNPVQPVPITVNPLGKVVWYVPLFTQTSCPELTQKTYPNEEVECVVTIGTWMHDGWQIDSIHGTLLHMDEFVDINPRWELIKPKTRANRTLQFYEGYDLPFIFINIYFPMKRRPIPEIEVTRNPCIIAMLLTLSVFWLPPNSEKKTFVLGFVFLILNLLLVYVSWSTKFPLGVLLAGTFLQSTMYIVVATFLLQVLIIFNVCSLSGPSRPPPVAMQLLSGPLAKYICLRWSSSSDVVPMDRVQLKEDSTGVIESPTPKDDWMLFAAGLDRFFFIVMSISMIAIHQL